MTVQQINQWPINLAAKSHLERARQNPEPESPYLLQLAQWGLDDFLMGQSGDLQQQLEDTLRTLWARDPKEAIGMFYPDSEQAEDAADAMRGKSPTDAACMVLEDLVREAIDMTFSRSAPPAPASQSTYLSPFGGRLGSAGN